MGRRYGLATVGPRPAQEPRSGPDPAHRQPVGASDGAEQTQTRQESTDGPPHTDVPLPRLSASSENGP